MLTSLNLDALIPSFVFIDVTIKDPWHRCWAPLLQEGCLQSNYMYLNFIDLHGEQKFHAFTVPPHKRSWHSRKSVNNSTATSVYNCIIIICSFFLKCTHSYDVGLPFPLSLPRVSCHHQLLVEATMDPRCLKVFSCSEKRWSSSRTQTYPPLPQQQMSSLKVNRTTIFQWTCTCRYCLVTASIYCCDFNCCLCNVHTFVGHGSKS